MLDTIDGVALRAYVVWVPILPDDSHAGAVDSSALVSDARAGHFWDERGLLPPLFAQVLGLPNGWPAWDVYLAYTPGTRWGATPPAPAFWQHQLGDLTTASRFDGSMFAAQVRAILGGSAA